MKKPIEQLSQEWLEAKHAEVQALEKRREIEEEILSMIQTRDEGTTSETMGSLKLSITFKMDRKVDANGVQEAWNMLPPLVQEAFIWKPDLVLRHARAIESANPEAYKILAQFITVKPARPSVKVEQKQEEE